jgi:hypothetical protein
MLDRSKSSDPLPGHGAAYLRMRNIKKEFYLLVRVYQLTDYIFLKNASLTVSMFDFSTSYQSMFSDPALELT